jgi:nicotinamidase/pyrazinamidase
MRSSDQALVVVDLQYDFMPGGALSVAEGDRIVSIANRVQQKFELVVATQDWHPPDHGSFVANHPSRKVGDVVDLDGLEQILWPVHCVQGTRGAELVEQLDTLCVRRIFQKGTDPRIDS